MNDQAFNIKFVGEVEKFPVLYNYKLKGYSKKNVTEKAWDEIGKEVNLSIGECKDKWRNLRSVFVRRLKPTPPGSRNKTKPYYLSEAMRFTLPYIRTLGKSEGNLPEGGNEEDSSEGPPPTPPLFESQTSHLIELHCTPSTTDSVSTPAFKKKRKQHMLTDVDMDYMSAIRRRLEKHERNSQAKKQFLDSLLPEIEPLTEEQMRIFRRKVLQLIDEIRFQQDQYHLGSKDTSILSPNVYSSSSCSPAH